MQIIADWVMNFPTLPEEVCDVLYVVWLVGLNVAFLCFAVRDMKKRDRRGRR